jgi:hypothetical protein
MLHVVGNDLSCQFPSQVYIVLVRRLDIATIFDLQDT